MKKIIPILLVLFLVSGCSAKARILSDSHLYGRLVYSESDGVFFLYSEEDRLLTELLDTAEGVPLEREMDNVKYDARFKLSLVRYEESSSVQGSQQAVHSDSFFDLKVSEEGYILFEDSCFKVDKGLCRELVAIYDKTISSHPALDPEQCVYDLFGQIDFSGYKEAEEAESFMFVDYGLSSYRQHWLSVEEISLLENLVNNLTIAEESETVSFHERIIGLTEPVSINDGFICIRGKTFDLGKENCNTLIQFDSMINQTTDPFNSGPVSHINCIRIINMGMLKDDKLLPDVDMEKECCDELLSMLENAYYYETGYDFTGMFGPDCHFSLYDDGQLKYDVYAFRGGIAINGKLYNISFSDSQAIYGYVTKYYIDVNDVSVNY